MTVSDTRSPRPSGVYRRAAAFDLAGRVPRRADARRRSPTRQPEHPLRDHRSALDSSGRRFVAGAACGGRRASVPRAERSTFTTGLVTVLDTMRDAVSIRSPTVSAAVEQRADPVDLVLGVAQRDPHLVGQARCSASWSAAHRGAQVPQRHDDRAEREQQAAEHDREQHGPVAASQSPALIGISPGSLSVRSTLPCRRRAGGPRRRPRPVGR